MPIEIRPPAEDEPYLASCGWKSLQLTLERTDRCCRAVFLENAM